MPDQIVVPCKKCGLLIPITKKNLQVRQAVARMGEVVDRGFVRCPHPLIGGGGYCRNFQEVSKAKMAEAPWVGVPNPEVQGG